MELILKLMLVGTLIPLFQSLKIPDYRQSEDVVALLTKRMDAIEARNAALAEENAEMKTRIQALETLTTNQQKEIQRLGVLMEEQTTVDQHLEEPKESENIKSESENIKSETENIKSETENSESETNKGDLETNDQQQLMNQFPQHKGARSINRITKASNENTVAFFATLSAHLDNPGVHQTIRFDHVITNIGNGYNQHAGDFRAPVSGVYVFSTTLMAGVYTSHYHFQYMKNSAAISNIYIHSPAGGTATQDAVLYLNAGDDVSIHNLDAGNRVYGSNYSSFSGFLLQEDFSATTPGIIGK